ncbi:MAG: Efflux ABC transporter, permease protein, partial [uncultured Solirubrobacteraceae bacterium]
EHPDDAPADDDAACSRRGGGGAAQGARLDAAPAARNPQAGRDGVRLARDAQGQARPRAAARRDDHAGDVRPDVHLPVRRGDRRFDGRIPELHPAGRPRDVHSLHDGVLRHRAEHGPHEGRRRPLPLAADLAPGAARRRAARRHGPLPHRRHRDRRARRRARVSPRCRHRRRAGGDGARARVRLRAVLGLHDARSAAALAQCRDERRLHGDLPADVPQQRLRRARDAARRAEGVRRRQPDLDPVDGVARADARQRRHQRHPHRARDGGGADGDLRAAYDAAVPARL